MNTLVHELRDGLCVEDQRCAVRTAESGCDCARIADYIEQLRSDLELRNQTALAEIERLQRELRSIRQDTGAVIAGLQGEIERLQTALTEIADLLDQVFARGLDPFLLGQAASRVKQALGHPRNADEGRP